METKKRTSKKSEQPPKVQDSVNEIQGAWFKDGETDKRYFVKWSNQNENQDNQANAIRR